jgi:DNA-binding LacI/PurR family transcriptional regulator
MKTIAREAGVSVMAVSLALRNHPRISEETRKRVFKVAQRLGYRTNPLVASLMTHIRSSRPVPYQANLAFFTAFKGADDWKKFPFNRVAYQGMRERAEDLGFLIDTFWLEEPGMRNGRMGKVLKSRNIQGVILAPLPVAGTLDHLDWSQWSAAALGNSLLSPRIHRVTHHQFHGMSLILENLVRKGYRRIGLVIDNTVDGKVEYTWSSCMAGFQLRIPARDRVPIHLVPSNFGPAESRALDSWLKKHRPEVVIGHDGLLTWLGNLGVQIPGDVAFAHVSLPSEMMPKLSLSGLNQNWGKVGAAAVDSIVAQIYRNERGIPENPKTIMLEGFWVEGETTPGI